MVFRSFSLTPPYNSNSLSNRFTQMDNLFSKLTGEKPLTNLPPYNLLQKNKENYELIVSVPGYSQEELDITVLSNQLIINGIPKKEKFDTLDKNKQIKYIHEEIKKNEFSLVFNLDYRLTIQQASLEQGLLKIQFSYDIPEKEKPQKISINNKNCSISALEHNNS